MTFEVPSYEEFKDKMRKFEEETEFDEETPHVKADSYMCNTLRALGYGEGINIFEHMIKWYS